MSDIQTIEMTEDGKKILQKIPFTGVRRAIAENLVRTWTNTVPTSGFIKFDCTEVKQLKAKYASEGKKFSYTEIFMRLVVTALEKHPIMNSSLVEKKIELYKSINIGFATATPEGMLLVPVVRDAQEKSIDALSQEVKLLAQRVREKRVTAEDLSGGTVTISSMGMFDTYGMSPILVYPQVLILGFGSIRNEPVVLEDGTIGIKPLMYVSNTIDHRVIQGEPCAQFIKTLSEHFKEPAKYMEV